MARIRTLKPEFWQDEKLSALPPIDRLVFVGLISQADDAGRLVDNVRLIDGLLFPSTDDSSRDSLDTLMRISRISRYTSSSGQALIQINGWTKHQRVEHPSTYVLPPPAENGPPPETLMNVSGDSHSSIPDLRPTTYYQTTPPTEGENPPETVLQPKPLGAGQASQASPPPKPPSPHQNWMTRATLAWRDICPEDVDRPGSFLAGLKKLYGALAVQEPIEHMFGAGWKPSGNGTLSTEDRVKAYRCYLAKCAQGRRNDAAKK